MHRVGAQTPRPHAVHQHPRTVIRSDLVVDPANPDVWSCHAPPPRLSDVSGRFAPTRAGLIMSLQPHRPRTSRPTSGGSTRCPSGAVDRGAGRIAAPGSP